MKILHIITRLDQGGSAEAVMQIGHGLLKRGHDVKIITGLTKDPQEDFSSYTKRTGVPIIVISHLRREINPFFDLLAFWRLYRLIKKEKAEVVHTHTSKAGILGRWAAWLCGVDAIIHSSHGHVLYGYFGSLKNTLFLWTEKLTASITDRITTLTDLEIKDYQKLGLSRQNKFVSIPYGPDTERYRRSDRSIQEIKQMLGIFDNDRVVAWVGRLVPVKDCGTFLKAISLIKDKKGLRFLVVGDGTEKEKLEDMAGGLGIEVIFTGARKDIYDIMSVMNLLVLSSLNEGLGRVIIEAMAAHKPVVATRVGGVPEVVEDGVTGILVSPSNPEEMANAITNILANPEMMRIMGEKGERRAEGFDIQIAIERLETLYVKGGEIK